MVGGPTFHKILYKTPAFLGYPVCLAESIACRLGELYFLHVNSHGRVAYPSCITLVFNSDVN